MIRSGRKTVAVVGTAERLIATSTPALWLRISAEGNNAGEVLLGDSAVDAAAGAQQGVRLGKGIAWEVPVFIPGPLDLTDLWLDVTVNTDGASFFYMEP